MVFRALATLWLAVLVLAWFAEGRRHNLRQSAQGQAGPAAGRLPDDNDDDDENGLQRLEEQSRRHARHQRANWYRASAEEPAALLEEGSVEREGPAEEEADEQPELYDEPERRLERRTHRQHHRRHQQAQPRRVWRHESRHHGTAAASDAAGGSSSDELDPVRSGTVDESPMQRGKRHNTRRVWTEEDWKAFNASKQKFIEHPSIYELEVREAQNSSLCNYTVIPIENRNGRVPSVLEHVKCNHAGSRCQERGTYCCIQTYRMVEVSYADGTADSLKVYSGCVCALQTYGTLEPYKPDLELDY